MDELHQKSIREIAQQFSENAAVLQAIGDETRQHILLCMLELPGRAKGGARVGRITEKTHLSRPAVSRHLRILKSAGIVGMRSEGTRNYYYLTSENGCFERLRKLFEDVIELSRQADTEKPA